MRTKRPVFFAAAALLLSLVPLHETSAQTLINGTLLDERTDEPISAGVISLLNDQRRIVMSAETDVYGFFELWAGTSGRYIMRSQRLGYLNTSTPAMELVPGDTLHVEFRISPDAVFLAPITIRAKARPWWETSEPVVLWSYYERRDLYERMGMGRFLDRRDLEKYDGMPLWQMLGTLPGVQLHQSEDGFVQYASLRAQRGLLRPCQPDYYLDGMHISLRSPDDPDFGPPDTIDAFLTVSQIVGMEVYSGAAQVPGVFGGTNANCGVIALWTSRQG
jgi:hypothetical protein